MEQSAGPTELDMVWVAITIAALLGLALALAGLRGRRIDLSPVCRRCRFNLSGVYPAVQTCPECGADLADPTSVRTGERRKRAVPLAGGLVLVLAATLVAGALGWSRTSGFDWNTVKPVSMLLREGASSDVAVTDAALRELNTRLAAGSLSSADRDRVFERALRRQADRSAGWRAGWGDFVETLWLNDRLSEEQKQRYARGALVLSLHPRARIGVGEHPVAFLHQERRTGTLGLLQYHVVMKGVRQGDLPVNTRIASQYGPLRQMPPGPGSIGQNWLKVLGEPSWEPGQIALDEPSPAPAPGRHPLVCRLEVAVGTGKGEFFGDTAGIGWDADERWSDGVPTPSAAAAACWREELRAEFEVLAEGVPSVELVIDPSLREAVEDVLSEMRPTLQQQGDGRWTAVMINIPDTQLPIGLAFEVFWRHAGGELRVGSIDIGDRAQNSILRWPRVAKLDDPAVDVVFRPSATVAGQTLDLHRIWGEEIVRRSVPVARYMHR